MSRIFKPYRLTLAIVFTVASINALAAGYLPRIGPSPLRFALVKPTPTQPPESFALPPETTPSATNDDLSAKVETATNVPPPAVAQTETNSPAPHAEFVPADNMLSISPKMLNELFRASSGSTNQTQSAPVPTDGMNFQPPPMNEPPVSRATYKSE
ncbi:MAG TPA: hypothetical protein VH255_07140 [Verrucomicrobiae bacterium]|jgi:hypothetical protein|nr:hypothetical protein [Verrucomicrobiae bacterium]